MSLLVPIFEKMDLSKEHQKVIINDEISKFRFGWKGHHFSMTSKNTSQHVTSI